MQVTMSQHTNGEAATDATLSVRLAEAIADAKGVDVLALDPLYNVLDVEALARVSQSVDGTTATAPEVRLQVAGCRVIVTENTVIKVTPLDDTPSDTEVT